MYEERVEAIKRDYDARARRYIHTIVHYTPRCILCYSTSLLHHIQVYQQYCRSHTSAPLAATIASATSCAQRDSCTSCISTIVRCGAALVIAQPQQCQSEHIKQSDANI